MVSGGCVISGSHVKHSLLYSNCIVNSYSKVTDSLLLPDVEIGRYCRIKKAIIDRGAKIAENTMIGEDPEEDRARGFRVTESGITLVTPDMLGQELHMTR
jgi:glucose-1-phosphate adenylyltransferase